MLGRKQTKYFKDIAKKSCIKWKWDWLVMNKPRGVNILERQKEFLNQLSLQELHTIYDFKAWIEFEFYASLDESYIK